jgi:hypothetical protein
MRFARLGLFVCVLFLALPTFAQVPLLGPPPPIDSPVRDAQAVAAVQNAVNALGGAAVIGQARSCVVQGNVTGSPGALTPSGSFRWEAAGAEYRFEGSASAGNNLFVTGHGNPAQSSAGKSQAISPYVARAMFVPALVGPVLLQELQNQSYSIRFSGTDTIGTESVLIITTAAETTYPDNVITPQSWYFDASTGLPVRVDFRSPAPRYPASYVNERFDYSDFRVIAGTIFPFQISLSINGQPVQTFGINTISVNASVPPSDFDAPSGGAL